MVSAELQIKMYLWIIGILISSSLLFTYLYVKETKSSLAVQFWSEINVKLLVRVLYKSTTNDTNIVFPQVISKLHNACLLYENWKKDNRPNYKPWLYPEQNALPFLSQGDITKMTQSATDPDLLHESEVTEDLCSDDSEQ